MSSTLEIDLGAELIKGRRFAPLLQRKGTIENPSRVIITASVAGIGVGSLGKNATFGYSASKAAVIRKSSIYFQEHRLHFIHILDISWGERLRAR